MKVLIADSSALCADLMEKSILDNSAEHRVMKVSEAKNLQKNAKEFSANVCVISAEILKNLDIISDSRDIDFSDCPALVTSGEANTVEIRKFFTLKGVRGFFYKQDSLIDFLAAVQTVAEGRGMYLHPRFSEVLTKPAETESRFSEVQLEILKMTALGKDANEIAIKLSMSVHTVNYHKRSVYADLGAINAPHLVFLASKEGLI